MRNFYRHFSCLILFLLFFAGSFAQDWPATITLENGQQVKLYSPQPNSFTNDRLVFRSAISITRAGSSEPVFGMVWANAQTRSRSGSDNLDLSSISVTDIRFPADISESYSKDIKAAIESAIPERELHVSKKQVQNDLKLEQEKQNLDQSFSNKAPKVIYRNHPAILVLIDGDPVWQKNEAWGVEVLANSPGTLIKNDDGQYYLYGASHWYRAKQLTGPYNYVDKIPANLSRIEENLPKSTGKDQSQFIQDGDYTANMPVSEIIVSMEPAELIQSDGEAAFNPITNTNLLYVENSPNDIFMDIESQQYYILLAGRWYTSRALSGNWTHISADKLPPDFSRIPPGSAKDNVLSSVAGTPAAKNAILDAQVPQTAKVNRNSAKASVNYDGTPEFENISGTQLAYARNTASTVIRYKGQYFLVDNGIWFRSFSPSGPWIASSYRPEGVDLIPPTYPVYNVKYVYIYDVTPQFIYVGYTPGYLNTFIYGPTIVFGTGYYYRPWHRHYYYPRPFTWGFNMQYTPWTGWSFGFNFYGGWFNMGWWGPSLYRPPYCAPYYHNCGYYGYRNNQVWVNERPRYPSPGYYSRNNIYQQRRDIVTPDRERYYSSRPDYRRPTEIDNRNDRGYSNTRPETRNEWPGREVPSRGYEPGDRSGRDRGNGSRPPSSFPPQQRESGRRENHHH
ncbi:hypothetical protein [Flavihumibacter profundi]|uniref:hypothetical protein n=1 Tax=Flavihumibacter profundi TaxID=2716883 RepID=UPI001CC6B705|nr:hypothetical protein [Flavihumibacter profundi]MBZ5856361.1 hypothetical protein [Flavihumibacter profundi]